MEDIHVEHQRRLSSLLGLSTCPTRQTLIKDIVSKFRLSPLNSVDQRKFAVFQQRLNVVSLGLPPAQGLLQWLETEFSPLRLAQEIEKHLAEVEATGNAAYSQYVDALREVAAVKILKQVEPLLFLFPYLLIHWLVDFSTISINHLGTVTESCTFFR